MDLINYKTRRSLEREKFLAAREFFLAPGVIKASNHGLRLGSKDDYYFDLDFLINDPYKCQKVLGIYTDLIQEIKQNTPIDFLVFIDKASGGTVGAIRLSAALSINTNIPNVTVRPGKAISFEKVKIPRSKNGLKKLRAIIISDHCTSGSEVLLAADILRENGAIVEHAVVYTIRPDKLEANRFQDANITLRNAFELPAYNKLPQSFDELAAIAVNY